MHYAQIQLNNDMATNMLVEDPSYNGVVAFVNNTSMMTFESWFCSTSTWFVLFLLVDLQLDLCFHTCYKLSAIT
jgi:hypothetical protein